ncbi:acyl-CoA carboxylase epsilon subunit [Streptomyces sp. NPDC087263]|uniref:acyl-CoA carboxylase epsilon subunit n=1 Tax=Streptomyces sp. NPDC087263 TaxID=3365773 RepID=UPI0038114546
MTAAEPERRACAESAGPPLVVVAGNPTPEELAAVTAALLALARVKAVAPAAPTPRAAWSGGAAQHG